MIDFKTYLQSINRSLLHSDVFDRIVQFFEWKNNHFLDANELKDQSITDKVELLKKLISQKVENDTEKERYNEHNRSIYLINKD